MMSAPASHVMQDQSEVFAFLARPSTYGIAGPVKRIDTHGAAVFLAGADAYKVKRAVKFPFMDFSTLELRREACAAEIRINSAFAPQLYLAAVPITRSGSGLKLGGEGEVVDWAVHMRRFDEHMCLDELAEAGRLPADLPARLAPMVLAAHTQAPVREGVSGADNLVRCAEENRIGLAEFPDLFAPDEVAERSARVMAEIARLRPQLEARSKAGFVRRCHGDMHLRNIVLMDGQPVLFDAIEFSEQIATSDTLYDLAFLLMDLWERGEAEMANALFCRYVWHSAPGNLSALNLMPLFMSMRAAIRAKVSAAALQSLPEEERAETARDARGYFALAERFLVRPKARLIAIGGLSGSGKSRIAAALAPLVGPAPGALVLRSDIERKLQAGRGETERLDSAHYTKARTDAVYAALRKKAHQALQCGWPVIVDAMHAREGERQTLEHIAAGLGARFAGLWLDAPLAVRLARIGGRRGDASDADAAVAEKQEGYALGQIGWRRIAADAEVTDVLARAQAALADG